MSPVALLAAGLLGFLGSTHCVAMCGGVVAMSCSAVSLRKPTQPRSQWQYLAGYNAGRILSYSAAGAVAGALGSGMGVFGAAARAQLVLRLVAGLMMMAVGLYIAGYGAWLRRAEALGRPLWSRVAPLAKRLVPVQSPWQAFALGLVWGWLPCGLVYGALATAVTSGSVWSGAATMASFGLGTLPMLVAMGSTAAAIAQAARVRAVRWAAGAAIVAFGVFQWVHTTQAWARTRNGEPPVCCPAHHHHV